LVPASKATTISTRIRMNSNRPMTPPGDMQCALSPR
jgi:hypothetical protein